MSETPRKPDPIILKAVQEVLDACSAWIAMPNTQVQEKIAAAVQQAYAPILMAAAEEIHKNWDAHCDAEGYGPSNLMRRLEGAIPAEYGYTAGAWEELKRENAALRAAQQWQPIETCDKSLESFDLFGHIPYDFMQIRLTDCEFKDGEYWYFQAGEMLKCSKLGFTPTHWKPIVAPREEGQG